MVACASAAPCLTAATIDSSEGSSEARTEPDRIEQCDETVVLEGQPFKPM